MIGKKWGEKGKRDYVRLALPRGSRSVLPAVSRLLEATAEEDIPLANPCFPNIDTAPNFRPFGLLGRRLGASRDREELSSVREEGARNMAIGLSIVVLTDFVAFFWSRRIGFQK